MITTMFFILVPFLKRAPCIIIHLARNAEKGGGVLMSIILPNLNHSFVPVPVPVPVPDSGFRFRFRIPDFLVFHTPGRVRVREREGQVDIPEYWLLPSRKFTDGQTDLVARYRDR